MEFLFGFGKEIYNNQSPIFVEKFRVHLRKQREEQTVNIPTQATNLSPNPHVPPTINPMSGHIPSPTNVKATDSCLPESLVVEQEHPNMFKQLMDSLDKSMNHRDSLQRDWEQ